MQVKIDAAVTQLLVKCLKGFEIKTDDEIKIEDLNDELIKNLMQLTVKAINQSKKKRR